jgi:hypothetical protein
MKIRTGFVSNSSSSSFLICSKSKDEKVIHDKLADLLRFSKAPDGFADEDKARFLADIMADAYLEPYGDAEIRKYDSWDEYFKWLDYEDDYIVSESYKRKYDKWFCHIKALFDEGFVVDEGEMPDYGDGGDTMQYFLRLLWYKYIDDDFGFIECDGGDEPDVAGALAEREKRRKKGYAKR